MKVFVTVVRCLFLLFSLVPSTAAKKDNKMAKQCTQDGIYFCNNPKKVKQDDVRCWRNSCRWRLEDLKPNKKPSFCDEARVEITSIRQDVDDEEEPCLLWEIMYGRFATDRPTQSPSSLPVDEDPPLMHSEELFNEPSLVRMSMPLSGPPPFFPSRIPSHRPTFMPSQQHSLPPSGQPSSVPSKKPLFSPTAARQPSSVPSKKPSLSPTTATQSGQPSLVPSKKPSSSPTAATQSGQPSSLPFEKPSSSPAAYTPAEQPSSLPSEKPSMSPTAFTQAKQPSSLPSRKPSSSPFVTTKAAAMTIGNYQEEQNDEFLETNTWIGMKSVILTFVTSPLGPTRARHHGRSLAAFDFETKTVMIELIKKHLMGLIKELAGLKLFLSTIQEVQMVDGSIASLEAITGQLLLGEGARITREELDEFVVEAFQGENLQTFLISLLNAGDPSLAQISGADYDIPPGLSIFANGNSRNEPLSKDDGYVVSKTMHVFVLAGTSLIFLTGALFLASFARRAYSRRAIPLTPVTKGTVEEFGSPNRNNVPDSIGAGDGHSAIAVSDLAVSDLASENVLAGVSDSASLYSYTTHTGAEADDLSQTYDPSYCGSVQDGGSVTDSCKGDRSDVEDQVKRRRSRKPVALPPRANTYANLYRFDDSQSANSSQSGESKTAAPLSNNKEQQQLLQKTTQTNIDLEALASLSSNKNTQADSESEGSGCGAEESNAGTFSQNSEAFENSSLSSGTSSKRSHNTGVESQQNSSQQNSLLHGQHLYYESSIDDDSASLFAGPANVDPLSVTNSANVPHFDLGPLAIEPFEDDVEARFFDDIADDQHFDAGSMHDTMVSSIPLDSGDCNPERMDIV